MTAEQWVEQFAKQVGAENPSRDEFDEVLKLAAEAAHASERTAAPRRLLDRRANGEAPRGADLGCGGGQRGLSGPPGAARVDQRPAGSISRLACSRSAGVLTLKQSRHGSPNRVSSSSATTRGRSDSTVHCIACAFASAASRVGASSCPYRASSGCSRSCTEGTTSGSGADPSQARRPGLANGISQPTTTTGRPSAYSQGGDDTTQRVLRPVGLADHRAAERRQLRVALGHDHGFQLSLFHGGEGI